MEMSVSLPILFIECQCYKGQSVLPKEQLCYHSESYKVSLKDMIYRTLSLSYMFGQCIYVIFLSVSLIL